MSGSNKLLSCNSLCRLQGDSIDHLGDEPNYNNEMSIVEPDQSTFEQDVLAIRTILILREGNLWIP